MQKIVKNGQNCVKKWKLMPCNKIYRILIIKYHWWNFQNFHNCGNSGRTATAAGNQATGSESRYDSPLVKNLRHLAWRIIFSLLNKKVNHELMCWDAAFFVDSSSFLKFMMLLSYCLYVGFFYWFFKMSHYCIFRVMPRYARHSNYLWSGYNVSVPFP